MSEPDVVAAPRRKRHRTALACVECRRRKVKCDRKDPCDQCTGSKNLTCTFGKDEASTAVNGLLNLARPKPTPSTVRSPAKSRNVRLATAAAPSSAGSVEDCCPAATWSWGAPRLEASPSGPTSQDVMDRLQRLERRLSDSVSRQEASGGDMPSPQRTSQQMQGSLIKSRFFSSSHWMTALEEFKTIKRKLRVQSDSIHSFPQGHEKSEIHSLLVECKRLAKAAKAERRIQRVLNPNFGDYVPTREISDKLVHFYLANFESTYRILHIPTFRREYSQYWENPEGTSTSIVVKLLLVIAIGTCFYSDEGDSSSLRVLATQCVYAAQWWLSGPFEKASLDLTGLQVHCLLLLARQTSIVDGDLIWISAGSLVRASFSMGLHRDPKYFPQISVFYAELRRRLWATILEMSIQSSIDSGMPPLISFDDFDTEAPSHIDDDSISETTKIPPISKPSWVFTQTSIQTCLLRSLRYRLEVARTITSIRWGAPYDEVLRLGAELTNCCRENSAALMSFSSSPSGGPTTCQGTILDLFVRRFLLALHFPFALKAKSEPQFYFSRKVCLECSMTILSYRGYDHSSPNSAGPTQDGFARLQLVAGGAFKGEMFHASLVVCLELITQLEEENATTPFGTMKSVSRSAREPLRQAIRDMIELSAQRIALGEHNVKGHLFLSMALGQIEAMEEGLSTDDSIMNAAKRSTETCCALLKARTKSSVLLTEEYPVAAGNGPIAYEMISGREQDFGSDFLTDDANLGFEMPESWLFSNWDENNAWL